MVRAPRARGTPTNHVGGSRLSGIEIHGAVTIRDGSHAIFELPNGIVARIGKPHSYETARRELRISEWLNSSGITTVRAVRGVPQPTVVDERPVTWWDLIPNHRPSTPEELVLQRHSPSGEWVASPPVVG
jgi:hypothetical protein